MNGTMTPLTNALGAGHPDVAEILMKAGASLDADLYRPARTPASPCCNGPTPQSDPQIKELIHRCA